MSFTSPETTRSHRPLLTVPRKSPAQDLQDIFEELELSDIPQSTADEPPPPSPLITFAPNSPPLSPVDLTSPARSFHSDLYATLKPVSAVPHQAAAPPTASMLPSRHSDHLPTQPVRRVVRYADLEAGHPALDNDEENPEAYMPAGWPYRHWRDYVWLAWEWLQNMQSLLMNLMEQEHRLGGARHTI
ncbi:MAG: hypothetical protein L6R38_002820 [Xanthoria sp. 2 TBL-2021]|nr:MAG: hypothetical protein L6R38_002820 [Xanthoria sp. 2 TBL-2021]